MQPSKLALAADRAYAAAEALADANHACLVATGLFDGSYEAACAARDAAEAELIAAEAAYEEENEKAKS
jgi:hypothetical protein